MPKGQTTLGTLSLNDSLLMYADREDLEKLGSCQMEIGRILSKTLSKCDSSLEVVIYTMREDPTKRTITAIFSAQKKTQEKSGQQ
jgi:hypothetical protein